MKKEYNTEEVKEYLYEILPLVDYIPYAQRAAKGYTLNKELLPTVEIPFPKQSERLKVVERKKFLISKRNDLQNALETNTIDYNRFIKTEVMGY